MNYIKSLEQDKQTAQASLDAINSECGTMLAFLHSSKFTGTDSDGARKDWISTADVIHWVQNLRSNAQKQ